jgi:Na+/proline symporter
VHPLDLTILVVYLAGTVLLGAYFSRAQRTVQDYFISGRQTPWWAIMGSIVATETSTVTFISVPGFAYGTNFTFLQLVMGYMIGRVTVVLLFVPAYFRGELLTVYQLLGQRFGTGVKRFASGLFLLTRSLADGFRCSPPASCSPCCCSRCPPSTRRRAPGSPRSIPRSRCSSRRC